MPAPKGAGDYPLARRALLRDALTQFIIAQGGQPHIAYRPCAAVFERLVLRRCRRKVDVERPDRPSRFMSTRP